MLGSFHRFRDRFHHHPIDRIGDFNSILSAISLYPQVVQLFSTHSTIGLSRATFWLISINSGIWFSYAVHRRVRPLVFSSLLNFSASTLILVTLYISPWS